MFMCMDSARTDYRLSTVDCGFFEVHGEAGTVSISREFLLSGSHDQRGCWKSGGALVDELNR